MSGTTDRKVINEAIAATIEQINDWFENELSRSDLKIQLVNATNAKSISRRFTLTGGVRLVDWDWEAIYFRKVKLKPAWMFELVQKGRTGALCYGQVNIRGSYATIEYLERKVSFKKLKGLAAQTAFQFAATVAKTLDLKEVRLVDPHPDLVLYYQKTLGLTRHPAHGVVQYLARRL
jgi:hypothetical protein